MTDPISLSDSDLDRESVAAQFVNNRDLQERIRDADILLLPFVAPDGLPRFLKSASFGVGILPN